MKPALRYFGTDGIRAVAGRFPLTRAFVRRIGAAAGFVLRSRSAARGEKRILLGMDTRASGPWILQALAEGLAAGGCQAVSGGVLPTSGVAALLRHGAYLGGAVISASHNPAEFNGIKFFSPEGKKIPDDWERRIESRLEDPGPAGRAPRSSLLKEEAAAELYADFLRRSLPAGFTLQGLRWVLDCAQGASYEIAPRLFRDLGAEVTALSVRPDGRNINRHCGALHTERLQKKIRALRAHGGCAFDGDADRVQFVDETGARLDGDVLIAMAARSLKGSGALPGSRVVTTVMANLGFLKEMKESGIAVEVTPVGDRSVWEGMEKTGAALGGEQSGHIIFRRFLPTGDGILTALQILRILRRSRKKLSHFRKQIPKYPQVLLNLKVRDKKPVDRLPSFQKKLRALEADLNGNGRILVRYSGTEPLLRIMVEGDSFPRVRRMAESLSEAAAEGLEIVSRHMQVL